MIGWLSGRIFQISPSGLVILDVGGVGYEIHVSMQTLCNLTLEERTSLFVHTHVREDQITLFGFPNPREREVFRKLIAVSGVGVRMAMNLMSGMPANALLAAVDASDFSAISRVPGIGKKTAQRLILELKGQLVEKGESAPPALADVHSALVNLGYKPALVDAALKGIDPEQGFESAFKAALKALA